MNTRTTFHGANGSVMTEFEREKELAKQKILEREWRDTLKVGDSVIYSYGHIRNPYYAIGRIVYASTFHIHIRNDTAVYKFNRKTGSELNDELQKRHIWEPTEELKIRTQRKRIIAQQHAKVCHSSG